jgi:hypothetical protein
MTTLLLYKDKFAYYEVKPLQPSDIKWGLVPFYHDKEAQLQRRLSEEHQVEYGFTKTNIGVSKFHDHIIDFGLEIVPICLSKNGEKVIKVEVKD